MLPVRPDGAAGGAGRPRRGLRPKRPRLPLAPIEALLEQRGIRSTRAKATELGVGRAELYRWRKDGMSAARADMLALRLDYHPVQVWGDAWWAA